MSLPLVDFVRTEDIPAVTLAVPVDGQAGPEATVRTLNADPGSGARSMVVDLPGGLRLPGGHWTCDVEVLLLAGAMVIGDQPVQRYGYLFAPRGVALGPLTVSARGARVLVFTDGQPGLIPADADAPGALRHRLVDPVHAADVPWEQPRTAGFPTGAARKTLREDPDTGQGFWLLGLLPHWSSPLTEWHTFAEENYVLEGTVQTAVGLMGPGAYLAHPPGEHTVHGPMRSRTGALLLTRAVGPLDTVYRPAEQDLPGEWR
jgi:hypothetical protein